MPSIHLRRVLPALSLLLVGCMEDQGERPCDLWTASAVVSGTITNSSGAPVPSAAVDVEVASTHPCDGTETWTRTDRVTTDASGSYSARLEIGNSRGNRCVRVTEVASGVSASGEAEFVGGCGVVRPPGQLSLQLVIP